MVQTLDREVILETVKGIKNGRIARVTYKSELPLKAEFKKQGYKIIKITETTGRFGVSYNNIQAVKTRKLIQSVDENYVPRKVTNNYEWIIENKVKHNNNTNKYYLVLAAFNEGANTKSQYIVVQDMGMLDMTAALTKQVFMDTYKDMVINSYWKPSTSGGEVRTIAFENVIQIAEYGEKAII